MGLLDNFFNRTPNDGIEPQNAINLDELKELVADGTFENVDFFIELEHQKNNK